MEKAGYGFSNLDRSLLSVLFENEDDTDLVKSLEFSNKLAVLQ